jgi:CDP-glucose 4,6-dehydratase
MSAPAAVVLVTTDKCYENHEWPWPYREEDPLGGIDPYSSSKACMEIVAASWRRAFPDAAHIATARAGNVIGGGDWAEHRIIPDAIRAFSSEQILIVRNPESVRPWQHVLEPLAGYLLLAQCLINEPDRYSCAWNFGPAAEDTLTVAQLCTLATQAWPQSHWRAQASIQAHEAGLLRLDSSKARQHLGWQPQWQANEAIKYTLAWYRARQQGKDMHTYSLQQIQEYLK